MKTSSYLERALFFHQSPAADQLYEARSEQLFELEEGNSSIQIYVQQDGNPSEVSDEFEVYNSNVNDSPISDAPLPIDSFFGEGPPHYDGNPGLRWQKVTDSDELEKIEYVGTP